MIKPWPVSPLRLAAPAALILFAAKDALMARIALPLPFWDEWDGAYVVLKPLLTHGQWLQSLFTAHNEHHIALTRLLIVGLYEISGYYDVILQMIVNAAIHAATVAWVAVTLSKRLSILQSAAVLALVTFLNSIPFSWENTLLGFNTHFYLLLTLSFGSLICLSGAAAFTGRWFAGMGLGFVSFLTMSSSALTFGAAATLATIQLIVRRRQGVREWIGVGLQLTAMGLLILAVPRIAEHESLRAHGIWDFLSALAKAMSWPAQSPIGLLLCAPALIFCVGVIARRPRLDDSDWLIVATYGWVILQFVALAIGRNQGPTDSRYLDTYLIGLCVSIVSAFRLYNAFSHGTAIARTIPIMVWICSLGIAAIHARPSIHAITSARHDSVKVQTANVAGYLNTGDVAYLNNKPSSELPYPSAQRLQQLLDDPEMRAALPPVVNPGLQPKAWLEAFKTEVLQKWWAFAAAGLLLAALNLTRIYRDRRWKQTQNDVR